MAFYPAHCDNNCKGCEKNSCGWCVWKDIATPEYKTEVFEIETVKSKYAKPYEWGDEFGYVKH